MTDVITMPKDGSERSVECPDCVHEHRPSLSGHGWAENDDLSDTSFVVSLPLGQEQATVHCNYGHPHLVVREGSDPADSFET